MKALIVLFFCLSSTAFAKDLVVFAAASLTDVLPKISAHFEQENNIKIKYSFDASSRLARQIEEGAPADLFFSADKAWNDHLIEKKQATQEKTKNLLGNDLVVVTHKKHSYALKDLKHLPQLNFKHLALAQENVPAGKYAREALKNVGVFSSVKNKIVAADNVRNTLAWVIKDEADLGIVFSTDAKSSPEVKVVYAIPPKLHSSVVYPVTLLSDDPVAKKFFDYLQSQEARKEFISFGFKPL